MIDYRAANRYANAFFLLAQERNLRTDCDRDLEKVSSFVKANPAMLSVILNPTIRLDDKESFADKIMGETFSPLTRHFVKLLIRKNRFSQLAAIQKRYHELQEAREGIREVVAISSKPLHDKVREKLHDLLTRKLKAKIRLVSKTDASIIGGLILRFNGLEIDTSFRSRIAELKQKLMTL